MNLTDSWQESLVEELAHGKNSTDTRQLSTDLTRKTSTPRVGLGAIIPVIERSKPVGALDLAEAVFGVSFYSTEIRIII
jgi:hypothetical protein